MAKHKIITTRYFLKYLALITVLLFIITSCSNSKKANNQANVEYKTLELHPVDDDKTEYEIIIIDNGYDSFLATQKPKEFYTKQYYENWNKYYVIDWNQKVLNSIYHSPKYQHVFEMRIDYDPNVDYGLDVNYKLYNYFLFVEKRYGVRFNVPRAISY